MSKILPINTVNCCEHRFSIRDHETYIYFAYYENAPTKSHIEKVRVGKETTLILKCPYCLNQRVRVFRFSKRGKLIKKLKLNGNNAEEHLKAIEGTKKSIHIPCPIIDVKYGEHILLFYNRPETEVEATIASLDDLMDRGTYISNVFSFIEKSFVRPEPKYIAI